MEKSLYEINPSTRRLSPKTMLKKTVTKPIFQYVVLGIILALFQALLIGGVGSATFVDMIKMVMAYSIMAIGYCFLLGYAGLASLGTAGFVGVGIYLTYFLIDGGLPLIVVLIVVALVAIVMGVIVGFISLRIEGIYLAIITLGLAEVLRYVLKAIRSQNLILTNKQLNLFGMNIGSSGMFFVVCVMLVLLMFVISNLIKSPTGRATIAMKNSTSASQAFGISLMKYRLFAFVVATLFAMLGGVAYSVMGNSISPSSEAETMLKLTLSLNILGAVIIGGYKSIWGSLFGVLLVFGISNIFAIVITDNTIYNMISPYISVIVGVLIILVVMFYPGGLAQLMGEISQKIKKAIKRRREKIYGKDI